jgi:2-oxoisovalerate dehydrogenase E1 component
MSPGSDHGPHKSGQGHRRPSSDHRDPLEAAFWPAVAALPAGQPRDPAGPVRTGTGLSGDRCLELFDAQLRSRHLDFAARWLQARGDGFYTIGSAGHEGNAAVAAALRPADPALLHYRSGAFYLVRAWQHPGSTPERDVLLGVCAAADEPIAGGRHKVFGNAACAVIPQTSTIGSHLPRALGIAFAIDRARRLGVPAVWPADAVTVCSFGDASVNHSTATGAINAACYCAHKRVPLPLLLVCEDNGLGISVPTPRDWVASAYGSRPGLRYFRADGCDLAATYDAATAAAAHVREQRTPAMLHLSMVRLLGHAGSDVESAYRPPADIARDLARDPLVGTARLLVAAGMLTPEQVLARYEAARAEIGVIAAEAAKGRRLRSAAEVAEPLAPRRPDRVAVRASAPPDPAARARLHGGRLPEHEPPLTLAQTINRALADVLADYPGALVFGEDVAVKGGVYGVTRGLMKRAGNGRVFDTLLDEQSILGLTLGTAISGLLPIAEIQYLAYLHNAEDQIRGEAASLQFFSLGQYRNPMVVRVAGYAYQKGFGGHFHNDNAVGVLRDIPGLVVATPAHPADAAAILRSCAAAAAVDGTVCVIVEPIALYHTRDLHADGDGQWLASYQPPELWPREHIKVGRGRRYGDGTDLTIVTFGNGLFLSLRASRRLAAQGIRCRILDLRWLAPLPVEDLVREATATGRVLIVDETRRSGGVSEGILAALVDAGFDGQMKRVTSHDSFVPLGGAATHVLVSEHDIATAVAELVVHGRRRADLR